MQIRERNKDELNRTKEELRLQREEHARRVKKMEAEQARLKQALIELERHYEIARNGIIENGEADLESLRR